MTYGWCSVLSFSLPLGTTETGRCFGAYVLYIIWTHLSGDLSMKKNASGNHSLEQHMRPHSVESLTASVWAIGTVTGTWRCSPAAWPATRALFVLLARKAHFASRVGRDNGDPCFMRVSLLIQQMGNSSVVVISHGGSIMSVFLCWKLRHITFKNIY